MHHRGSRLGADPAERSGLAIVAMALAASVVGDSRCGPRSSGPAATGSSRRFRRRHHDFAAMVHNGAVHARNVACPQRCGPLLRIGLFNPDLAFAARLCGKRGLAGPRRRAKLRTRRQPQPSTPAHPQPTPGQPATKCSMRPTRCLLPPPASLLERAWSIGSPVM